MKQLYFFIILMTSYLASFSQLVDKWDATYSSDATVNDIISDSNGNVYTLFTENNGSNFDIKLIKHNSSGTQQWVRTYASSTGNNNDYGIKLQIDGSDNIYFLGSINKEETNNGLVLKKYNSSGTQQYEYVSTALAGPVPYDFVISSSNEAFISAKRFNNSTVKNDARLYRISSTGSFSALATYEAGGASTDQVGYKVGITGSDVKMAVVDGTSNLRVLTYPTNFSTGTDTQTGNRRAIFSGLESIDGMHIVDKDEIYIYGKEAGSYFLRRHDTSSPTSGEYTTDLTDMDQINSMYVDASSNVYITGYETVTGSPTRNQLTLEKYNSSGTQQFHENLKPNEATNDHGNVHSSGISVHENTSGDIVVIGDLAKVNNTGTSNNDFVGAVIFNTSGVQQSIEPYGFSPSSTISVQAGSMDDNGVLYFAGYEGNTVYFYSQCNPPSVDLGADVTEDFDPSGNSLLLDAGAGFAAYDWSTGETSQTISVSEAGTYSVTVTNDGGCTATDEMIYSIDPIDQTITWSQTIPDQTYGDDDYLLSASSSSGLDVSFSSSDNSIAEAVFDGNDWKIQINGIGDVTITAAQAGNSNYNAAATIDKMFTISRAQFYWVGNSGDYSDFANHWATSTGGSAFHTFVPDQYCNVYFDSNSFTNPSQTVSSSSDFECHDFIVSGVSNNPTFDIQGLEVYGSVDFSSNAIYSIYAMGFASDEAETVDFNGATIDQGNQTERWTFYGDGSWEFTDDVTFSANYINVNNSADVIIGSGTTFTTTRPITLSSGTSLTNNGALIFESGANFLNQPGSSFGGNDFTFKRNTTFDASTGKYSIVGSPITNASTSSLGSLVYAYDESQDAAGNDGADRFVEVITPETMSVGQGYFSAYTGEISVTGMPNTGTVNVPLDYSTSAGAEADYDGFNLVSNPYPAGLSFQDFIDANGPSGSNAIESMIYLWVDGGSDAGQRSSSDYMTINSVGTVGGNTSRSGDYNDYLGSFQGFFVKATGTGQTLTFTEAMRFQYGSFDANFFREERQEIFRIRIGLNSSESYAETLIGYLGDATAGVDELYDAKRFSGSTKIDLATLIDGEEYAIQGRKLSEHVDIIPITFSTETSGIHSFDFSLEAKPDGADVILHDTFTDTYFSVEGSNEYRFTSAIGSFSDRFKLMVSSNVITAIENDVLNGISYSLQNNQLILKAANAIQSIHLFDMAGKEIYAQTFTVPSSEASIPISPNHSIFIIHSLMENGNTLIQKIAIK